MKSLNVYRYQTLTTFLLFISLSPNLLESLLHVNQKRLSAGSKSWLCSSDSQQGYTYALRLIPSEDDIGAEGSGDKKGNGEDDSKRIRRVVSKKLITPEELDRIFSTGSGSDSKGKSGLSVAFNSEYEDEDEEDEEEDEEVYSTDGDNEDGNVLLSQSSKGEKVDKDEIVSEEINLKRFADAQENRVDDGSISLFPSSSFSTTMSADGMEDLLNLVRQARLPPADSSQEVTYRDTDEEPSGSENVTLEGENEDGIFMASLDYVNMQKTLDKDTRKRLIESLSISEQDGFIRSNTDRVTNSADSQTVRTFSYNPRDTYRGDPMQYGAYRRWKTPEEETAKNGRPPAKGMKKKSPGKKGGKKDGSGSSTDSFYDAIRKLGSGPKPTDSPTTTGITEPPGNKKPIQPQKGLPKKNKRRVITPDDIDSLFKQQSKRSQDYDDDENDRDNNIVQKSIGYDGKEADNDGDGGFEDDGIDEEVGFFGAGGQEDDDEEDDDNDNNEAVVGAKSNKDQKKNIPSSSAMGVSSFNPMIDLDEEKPKWLEDAEKEEKKKKAAVKAAKKRKQITNDWRFWTALLFGAGFISAAYNFYQNNGGAIGSIPGPQELII